MTSVMSDPVTTVAVDNLLSGSTAPTPMTVSKYFTRSKSRSDTFFRLL